MVARVTRQPKAGGGPWQDRYLEKFYRREPYWIDGTGEFHNLCASVIPRGGRILEVGAGPTNKTSSFLATLGQVHGVDPDPDVQNNTALTSAATIDGYLLPFEADSFDACVSNYVVEHISSPSQHLASIRRVLRPGAPYVLRTPNLNHFVYRISSVTPHSFHQQMANRVRNLPSEAHDPYPTVYAMNTQKHLVEIAESSGFSVESLRTLEKEPSYGMSSRLLFLLFMGYERLVNSTDRLAFVRATMHCVLRRPPAS